MNRCCSLKLYNFTGKRNMAVRCSKIQKQFLILTGLFVLLTLVIHMMPASYSIHNRMMFLVKLPQFSRFSNLTTQSHAALRATTEKHEKKINIWKVVPDDDRILAQAAFNPPLDERLKPKRIVVSQHPEGWGVRPGRHTFINHKCPVQNCELVNDDSKEVIDARMYKEIDLFNGVAENTERHPDQVWILFALESPQASPSYASLNHVINWTATYRYDSTLMTPYDKFKTFANFTDIEDYQPARNYAEGKNKKAAIVVSNCYPYNDRLKFVEELQKHISVDVYGACGTMQCARTSEANCFTMLKRDYKFYLSFENANCKDYITEKLFMNALRNDVVPVVMGAHPDEYKRVAPKGSYIHVEDFPDAEALAKYMTKLSKDDDEYNKYFRWKQTGHFVDTKFWCRICSMLWDPDRPRMSVPDLQAWWRGGDTCIGNDRWTYVRTERHIDDHPDGGL